MSARVSPMKGSKSMNFCPVGVSINIGINAKLKAENLKIIPDDYDIAISKQRISHFVNRNKPVQYWIALEPDSEF